MSNDPAVRAPAACSFCDKPRYEVKTLIAGQAGYICDRCVLECGDIVNGNGEPPSADVSSPRALFEFLASRVIGQDAAKKQLAASVFHHQFGKRGAGSSRLLRKQNLLFLGPTGSGKTYLLQALARSLDIPMVTVSATSFSQTGYVGDEVESMLRYLLDHCDGDVARAQNGIVFIDEIDKLASRQSETHYRDVSGAGVQQDLLTMMEGCTVRLPLKSRGQGQSHEFTAIDTENIMFVAAGAFVGLENIVEKRVKGGDLALPDDPDGGDEHPKRRQNRLRRQVLVEDLISFGLLPEFAGRFTAYVPFDHLLTEDLVTVLRNPASSPVEEYRRYFDAWDIELVVDDAGIEAMAVMAEALATGARGLRSIVDRCFQDALFHLPEWSDVARIVYSAAAVRGEEKPVLLASDDRPVSRWSH